MHSGKANEECPKDMYSLSQVGNYLPAQGRRAATRINGKEDVSESPGGCEVPLCDTIIAQGEIEAAVKLY